MPGYLTYHTDEIHIAWEHWAPEPSHLSSTPISEQQRRHARRIAIVHVPQRWPWAIPCRNCHAPFPCATARWAIGILKTSGWTWPDALKLFEHTRTDLVEK